MDRTSRPSQITPTNSCACSAEGNLAPGSTKGFCGPADSGSMRTSAIDLARVWRQSRRPCSQAHDQKASGRYGRFTQSNDHQVCGSRGGTSPSEPR